MQNMTSFRQGHHYQGFEISGYAKVHVGDFYGDSKLSWNEAQSEM